MNLALVAHTHAYERSCPLAGGECVANGEGTVHITVGSGGAGLESESGSRRASSCCGRLTRRRAGCGYNPSYGNFSMAHLNAWGFLQVEAAADALELRFVLDENYTVWDRFTLKPWGQ